MSVTILDQTKHYAAVIKPAGVLSQSAEKQTDAPCMTDLLQDRLGQPVFPVHRLDRETAGVMVYAKTPVGASKLSSLIASGAFHKTYLAVVRGTPEKCADEWCDLLFRDAKRNKIYVVDRMRTGVKEARLSYETLGIKEIDGEKRTLVLVRLFTGRTHQIRVQFSHRGLPLVGDGRYGGGSGTLALFSSEICFACPFSGREKTYRALPEDGAFADFADILSEMAQNPL